MVEIAKAVSLDAKLIIMDEPTSSLGKEEIEQLMETVRGLKAKGVAILFVSHKLEELFELCDRVTVMRDGEHIITEDTVNLTEDSLINAMVGRTLDNLYPKEFGTKGEVWLEARGLNEAGGVLHDGFSPRPMRARSPALRASWAPGGRRPCGPCSALTGWTAARSTSRGEKVHIQNAQGRYQEKSPS